MANPEHIAPIIHRTMKKLKLQAWLPKEEEEQAQVIEWAQMMEGRYPKLRLLHASMNGILTDPKFGAKLKRLGRKPGVPDLFLPVRGKRVLSPCGSGLWIEMKRAKGKVRPEQTEWHDALRSQGYEVVVAHGASEAIAAIRHYLGIAA